MLKRNVGLTVVAVTLALVSALVACSPSQPAAPATVAPSKPAAQPAGQPTSAAQPAAQQPADQPKRGGTFRIAMLGDAIPNPFTYAGQLPTILLNKTIFSTLVRYSDKDLQPVPDLATEWKMDEGGKSWTFKLRRDVKWHDGVPFTAADVKFTLENIVNPKVNAQFRSNLRPVKSVDIIDDYTVRINTTDTFPSLDIMLAYNVAMAPKHLLEGKDLNEIPEFVQKPIGTGPFKFKEYVKGDHATVVANDDYYLGRPYLDSVVYKIIPDVNVIIAQLKTGELDAATIEPQNMDALKGASNIDVISAETPNALYIALNESRWPFQDKKVRQALMYGLDRKLIVEKILNNQMPLATGPLARAFGPYYNDKLQPYPYDEAKAKQLLAEAGFKPGADGILEKDGKKLSFELLVDKGNPTREQIVLTAQQYWKKLGIDVKVVVEEWNTFIKKGSVSPGDYDARCSWRITPPDPDKESEYATGGAVNHYMYSNPEADKLLADGKREMDKAKRIEDYKKFQEVAYEDVPVIWIYYPNDLIAINKRVQGFPKIGIRDALVYLDKTWIKQ